MNHSVIGSDKLKLGCWILKKSTRYFSVEINVSEEVEDLKKAIKTKTENALRGIDAYTLDLWRVSASSWHVSMRISDVRVAISTHFLCWARGAETYSSAGGNPRLRQIR